MVAVEKSRHEPGLFAAINQGANDIHRHFRRQHAQQYQFVAVIIPERRQRVILEMLVNHLPALIQKVAVHVTAQRRPEKRPVQTRIEQPFLPFRSTRHFDLPQQGFPRPRGFGVNLIKALFAHLCFQIQLGVFHADKGQAQFDFQNGIGGGLKVNHWQVMASALQLIDVPNFMISYRVEINLFIRRLKPLKGKVTGRANPPIRHPFI